MSRYAPETPPDEPVPPCDVCGKAVEGTGPGGCECPECDKCGASVDPRCAINGGAGCTTIAWRGFSLELSEAAASSDHAAWSTTYEHGYIGVSHELESSDDWSACIECGQLVADADGTTPEQALEKALLELTDLVNEHRNLVAELKGRK